ncbi:hypothetical protein Vadar_026422 [Vaccinium darrowii]|uniref:Uncharacterized protein n=1 Tax=Vaccinium darrowii TaxID=229202 RepID=A0ACB7YYR7_9ERIC|nr:hypothetical protein Vadar_026422 [Vaccinium darrowii]
MVERKSVGLWFCRSKVIHSCYVGKYKIAAPKDFFKERKQHERSLLDTAGSVSRWRETLLTTGVAVSSLAGDRPGSAAEHQVMVSRMAGTSILKSQAMGSRDLGPMRRDTDSVGTCTMCHEALEYLKKGGTGKDLSTTWYQIHVSAAKQKPKYLSTKKHTPPHLHHFLPLTGSMQPPYPEQGPPQPPTYIGLLHVLPEGYWNRKLPASCYFGLHVRAEIALVVRFVCCMRAELGDGTGPLDLLERWFTEWTTMEFAFHVKVAQLRNSLCLNIMIVDDVK